jgi:hypothetical protein
VSRLSRRAFVLGGAGVALAACGGSGSPRQSAGTPSTAAGGSTTGGSSGAATTTSTLPADQYQLVQFFKSGTPPADTPFRLPFGLGTKDGVLLAGGPAELSARVLTVDGKEVQAAVAVRRHDAQIERPYWPLPITLPLGTYQAVFTLGGKQVGSPAFFDVGGYPKLPRPGAALPVHTTPTTASTEGVDPICTRQPACPLHDVSLDTVLGKRPVALLVATPAYCQTAVCGPMLDVLLANRIEGITYLHAEVWKDDTFKATAPLLGAYGIDFEPTLFVVRADGTVADRLDVIYDADELKVSLAKAFS